MLGKTGAYRHSRVELREASVFRLRSVDDSELRYPVPD
jgi:hypothetical protein